MLNAILFARVVSQSQDSDGPLEAQIAALKSYAASKEMSIVKEFTYGPSNAVQERERLKEMVDFLRGNPDVRIVLAEKTDLLSLYLGDFFLVESLVDGLRLEIHLVKEGEVLRKEAVSPYRLSQGLFALLAEDYIQNLRERFEKRQLLKTEQGVYPRRAPFGYEYDRKQWKLTPHPTKAEIVKLIFRLYSSGEYTIAKLSDVIEAEAGEQLTTSTIRHILRSEFYTGTFTWQGRKYIGNYPVLVDWETVKKAQSCMSHGRGRHGTDKLSDCKRSDEQ